MFDFDEISTLSLSQISQISLSLKNKEEATVKNKKLNNTTTTSSGQDALDAMEAENNEELERFIKDEN